MANSKEQQESAEARFHKTIKKAHEAKQAMFQYEADARAVGEKTAKLKALRLAKEAREAAEAIAAKEAAATAPEKKKKASSKAAPKKAAAKKATSPQPEAET